MKKTKRLRPIEARTDSQICSLTRDNVDTKGFWILLDGRYVVLCEQKSGEPAKTSLRIPRSQFDRMARWYVTGRTT